MAIVLFMQIYLVILIAGWIQLIVTEASLLLPAREAALDRCRFALRAGAWIQRRVLLDLMISYMVVLPIGAILWSIDEIFFSRYRRTEILKPIILLVLPRSGSTSLHHLFSLDVDQVVTPTILELYMPFLCVQKVVQTLNHHFPHFVNQAEMFIKRLKGLTEEVEALHPFHLMTPDGDEILIGEWHWLTPVSHRTFPVAQYGMKNYHMIDSACRMRSLTLHQRMCQKILYNRGPQKRLLIKSHLFPCVAEFEELYPDAVFVGTVRDPVAVLRSTAGMIAGTLNCTYGMNVLAVKKGISQSPFAKYFVELVSDMMGCTADIYKSNPSGKTGPRKFFIHFETFKSDPTSVLKDVYGKVGLNMTTQMEMKLNDSQSKHQTYKLRHVYKNPEMWELGISDVDFRCLPSVSRYERLMNKGKE